jgi:hypothetical protein
MYYIIYFGFFVVYLLLPIFKPQEVRCWPIRELFMVVYEWPQAGEPGFDFGGRWDLSLCHHVHTGSGALPAS